MACKEGFPVYKAQSVQYFSLSVVVAVAFFPISCFPICCCCCCKDEAPFNIDYNKRWKASSVFGVEKINKM